MRDRIYRPSVSIYRDKWRNLVRKLKTHHRRTSPSLAVLEDACNAYIPFQQESFQSLTADMELPSPNAEKGPDRNHQNATNVMPQECQLQEQERIALTWRNGTRDDVPPWDTQMDCKLASPPPPAGRIIVVKWGEVTRKIGIDGSADAIKDAIRSAFGLRSKRSFWVEDEDGVVRSFDRTMPLTNYTLHIDPGVTIKLYHSNNCDRQMMNGEDATMCGEDDFHGHLAHYGWESLWGVGSYKDVDSIQELHPMGLYHSS